MSCGRKVETTFSHDRYDMADKLRDSGRYDLARAVERRQCLSDREIRDLRSTLQDEHNLHERFDYRLRDCHCDH